MLSAELISEKGGGQHVTMQQLGVDGSLQRIPSAYVGRYYGHATGVAPITIRARFPGMFTATQNVRAGAAAKDPPAVGREDEYPGGAPGVGGEGSLEDALDTYIARSSRRGTATSCCGVTPIQRKNRALYTKKVYSILQQDVTRRATTVIGGGGITLPAIPNPSGQLVFRGVWRGGRAAPLPYN